MAYSSVSIIALIVLLVTNWDLLFIRRSADKIPARRQYRFFIISVACFYIADLLWGLFEEYDIHVADYAVTVSFFALMSISVCLWCFIAHIYHRWFWLDGRWSSFDYSQLLPSDPVPIRGWKI